MKAILRISCAALLLTGCRRNTTPTDVYSSGTEGTTIDVYWPGDVPSIEIPIEYEAELPFIRCQINGKQVAMLVDTGCNGITLFQDCLNRLSVDIVPGESSSTLNTAAGPIEAVYCKPFRMTMSDGLYLNVSQAYVLPARSQRKSSVEGILGAAVLRSLSGVLVLDLGNAKLILPANKEAVQAPSEGDGLKVAPEE